MDRSVEPEGAGEHAPADTLSDRGRGLRGGALRIRAGPPTDPGGDSRDRGGGPKAGRHPVAVERISLGSSLIHTRRIRIADCLWSPPATTRKWRSGEQSVPNRYLVP